MSGLTKCGVEIVIVSNRQHSLVQPPKLAHRRCVVHNLQPVSLLVETVVDGAFEEHFFTGHWPGVAAEAPSLRTMTNSHLTLSWARNGMEWNASK